MNSCAKVFEVEVVEIETKISTTTNQALVEMRTVVKLGVGDIVRYSPQGTDDNLGPFKRTHKNSEAKVLGFDGLRIIVKFKRGRKTNYSYDVKDFVLIKSSVKNRLLSWLRPTLKQC